MRQTNQVSVRPLPESVIVPAPAPAPRIAIVLPTFNEAGNIEAMIELIDAALAGIEWEAIIVDDWSKDRTAAIAADIARRDPRVRLIRRFGRRGLASAIIEGALATTAPVVAVIDADRQHDETILPRLLDEIERGGADIAIGTRYADGGSLGEWTVGRALLSRIATGLTRSLALCMVSDPMSGFFAVRQSALVEALPRMSNVGYKVLLDLLASSPTPLAVREVPYTFRCRIAGESKLDSTVAFEFLLLILDKLTRGWIPPRLILFGLVGASGLAVHLFCLNLFLSGFGLPFKAAQTLAVTITIASNFALNNVLTYRDRRLHGWAWARGLAVFALVCGLGAIANIGVGSVVYSNHHRWWVAGIAGAAIGSIWNYAASSLLTWRRR